MAIPASDNPENMDSMFNNGLVIHKNAALAKTTDTRFSAILIRPRSARNLYKWLRVASDVENLMGNTICVIANHARGNITKVSGKPTNMN